jgi:chromosome segregation ATPase
MTFSVLATAQEALRIGQEVNNGANTGQINGKKVVHWSFYLLLSGTVAGGATAVAAYVMAMPLVALAGAALCLTNGVGAYYIKHLSNLWELEDYVISLSRKVHSFSSQISQLSQNNQRLKNSNQELEQIEEQFKKIPKNWQEVIIDGERKVRRQVEDIAKLTAKLEETEAKLTKLGAQVTSELKQATVSMAQQAVELCRQNGVVGEQVKTLEKNIEVNQQTLNHFQSGVTLLDVQTDQYEMVNKEFAGQIKILGALFEVVQKMFEETKAKMSQLVEREKALGDIVPKAVESTDKVQNLTLQLDEYYKKLQAQVELLQQKYETFMKWEDSPKYQEYKHYQARKKTAEYQEFLKWRERRNAANSNH